jgi:DNA polymerase III epsilon subunit-like protein
MAKAINSYIFLDTETGGLDCRKHALTQIAAVAVKGDTFEKIDLMSCFIQPYGNYEYDPEALKYTGVSFNDLENGVTIHEAVNEFIDLLKKADLNPRNKGSKPILVAYNSAFDKGFITQMFEFTKKMGELEKLTYGSKDFYGHYQPEMLDAIFYTKAAFGNDPDIPNFKLGTCMEKAGLDLNDAHVALNDTIAMKDMIVKFINAIRSGGNNESIATAGRYRDHFQF